MKIKTDHLFIGIGLFFMAIYLIAATQIIRFPSGFGRIVLFLLGPYVIFGITSMKNKYKPSVEFVEAQQVGYLFLIIAFVLFTTMLVVQQAGFYYYNVNKSLIANSKEIFGIFNSVQLGIDITFDIFYCLGILFFSLSFLKLRKLGLVVGLVGVVTSLGLLSLNLVTFPKPPKEAGLIDLGPLTIIWWILIIVFINRSSRLPRETIPQSS